MKRFILFISLLLISSRALAGANLYCGKFHWSSKFASDNIWIEDGKFNPSLSDTIKDFDKYYNELGFQSRQDGDCLCVKGRIKKAKYVTSGDKNYEFESIVGLFTCNEHQEIKTDIEALKKLGLALNNSYERHRNVLERWGLLSSDTFLSVYDKNFPITDTKSLDIAIETFKDLRPLKFRVIRSNKIIYVEYAPKQN